MGTYLQRIIGVFGRNRKQGLAVAGVIAVYTMDARIANGVSAPGDGLGPVEGLSTDIPRARRLTVPGISSSCAWLCRSVRVAVSGRGLGP